MTQTAINGSVLAVVATGPTGEPTVASLEMLGAARSLAEGLVRDFAVAIVAEEGGPAARKLAGCGAKYLYEVGVPGSADAPFDALIDAAWLAIQTAHPAVVFFADSQVARVGAARIAARMQCEFVGGCTFLKVRAGRVEMGRPCLSGKAFAQFEWDPLRPVVVTVAAGAFSPPPPTPEIPVVVALEVPKASVVSAVTIVSETSLTPEAMGVNDAEVIVAGGAGVGGPEGFGLLVELARKLGGTVAASRVAVDRGWMPSTRQVGLTGKSVSPRVYLAFGISGAPQHIAGIRSAGKVVAINRDPRAPIFDVADLAVVADLHDIIPILLDRLPALTADSKKGVSI